MSRKSSEFFWRVVKSRLFIALTVVSTGIVLAQGVFSATKDFNETYLWTKDYKLLGAVVFTATLIISILGQYTHKPT